MNIQPLTVRTPTQAELLGMPATLQATQERLKLAKKHKPGLRGGMALAHVCLAADGNAEYLVFDGFPIACRVAGSVYASPLNKREEKAFKCWHLGHATAWHVSPLDRSRHMINRTMFAQDAYDQAQAAVEEKGDAFRPLGSDKPLGETLGRRRMGLSLCAEALRLNRPKLLPP